MDHVWSQHKGLLSQVEKQIHKGVRSEVSLVNRVASHILNSGGKRIRPLLLILSAQIFKQFDQEALFYGGGIVEFIHTASLLHDDVIDNAEVRRGIPPARVLWGNQASILVGDYLYTLALSLAVKLDDLEINNLLADTCLRMAEGEMLQLSHSSDLDLTEATYLKIIEYKTALLISTSCRLGAIMGQASEKEKEALTRYGKNLGVAFQVADDTLDYIADGQRLGKSLGEDLKEGKITLPLIHLLKNCDGEEKRWLSEVMKAEKSLEGDLHRVVGLMVRYGSIQYAKKRARDFSDYARQDLDLFTDSPNKKALLTVADYVIRRDH